PHIRGRLLSRTKQDTQLRRHVPLEQSHEQVIRGREHTSENSRECKLEVGVEGHVSGRQPAENSADDDRDEGADNRRPQRLKRGLHGASSYGLSLVLIRSAISSG